MRRLLESSVNWIYDRWIHRPDYARIDKLERSCEMEPPFTSELPQYTKQTIIERVW